MLIISNNINNNINNNNNNKLPKAVITRVGKEVEHPHLKKCSNMVCVIYNL